jgi:hypothetical protein
VDVIYLICFRYRLCTAYNLSYTQITWAYKVKRKLHVGVSERKCRIPLLQGAIESKVAILYCILHFEYNKFEKKKKLIFYNTEC